jgi:hypothetical protein
LRFTEDLAGAPIGGGFFRIALAGIVPSRCPAGSSNHPLAQLSERPASSLVRSSRTIFVLVSALKPLLGNSMPQRREKPAGAFSGFTRVTPANSHTNACTAEHLRVLTPSNRARSVTRRPPLCPANQTARISESSRRRFLDAQPHASCPIVVVTNDMAGWRLRGGLQIKPVPKAAISQICRRRTDREQPAAFLDGARALLARGYDPATPYNMRHAPFSIFALSGARDTPTCPWDR